ncbi:MAG: MBL fold metallo-hydrolase [Alphaproteobacteria bacterium]|nr:MBL fold metallo-hydrolase [Alphaproteobacteria bacterium]
MGRWTYRKGLHDLGNGAWAYLLPDGSWGWSNAGLIVDGGETLLVDTLFDLALTGEMLARMRDAVPAARAIGTLVNTHANGDHTYGNQLVHGARIVASRAARDEMERRPPAAFIDRVKNWRNEGERGRIIWELMGRKFDFAGIVNTLPTETFEREATLRVGDKRIELVNVGPAHTRGDTLVHVPADRLVYTGDIVFVGGHPVMWAGPVANWIAACDRILAWDVETVVPGHGPITDRTGVRELRAYLVTLRDAARARFDAGLDWVAAAEEIVVDHFPHWLDRERVFVNVNSLYREFTGDRKPLAVTRVYEAMARWYWANRPASADHAHHDH